MSEMRYNNYHKHTHYSNIFTPDCNVHPEEYIQKAVEYGHDKYFTTEHGSFGDIFESFSLCKKYGIKCIAGIEAYIVPDPSEKDKSNYHIVIIPRTNDARKKMNHVSSMANINGYYYKPRISPNDLLSFDKDDLYITTACVAGLLKDNNAIENILSPLVNHFGDHVFLEVQSHNADIQKEINRKAIAWHNELGLKLIAANDSHYVEKEEINERLGLLSGKHITYDEEDELILDYPSYNVMFERFKKQGVLSDEQIIEAISNTLSFDDCEEIDLNYEIKMPTIYPNLTLDERYSLLESMANKEFEKTIQAEHLNEDEIAVRRKGIDYELQTIKDTNDVAHTADYFLFNTKNVDIAINKYGGVLTRGGRGSCASFYINKLFGMTQLDRFDINLPIFPDRFMSTARVNENRSLPDIDYNVMAQEPFVAASRELLGEHGCYPMIAYGTMQLSEAFRNVCRSKNLDYKEFNEVAKNIERYTNDKKWKPIIEEAEKYVGTIVSASVHPCAHLLLDKNILYEYGVVRLGDFLCVMMTSGEADEFKYLKNDYLIVKVWKLIYETFQEIGKPIIPAKELLAEIKNDEAVWDLFKNGITCTLNQVDSDNGMQQAKRFGIHSFEDGALIAAAIRPSFDAWRERFLNHENYSTGSKDLDKVLEQTHHYILYQENLMQYFDWLGVSPAESIGLIKKISKKKIKPKDFEDLEVRLRSNWIKQTGSEDMFDETWNMIQGCMAYGFASPHACATSLDMCYGAYLKAHYPYEYYCVCFNNYAGDEERTLKLNKELRYFGIELGEVQFRHSRAKYSYDKEKHVIYKGMGSIKFLNDNVSDELYNLKDKCYNNFVKLMEDIKMHTSLNSKQLDILIKINFFKEFGDINKLLRCVEVFNELYGRKNLKKTKASKLGIPTEICLKYSEKETNTQFNNANMIAIINWLFDNNMNCKPVTDGEIISYQQELLGYISYTDQKKPWNYCCVTQLDTKYSPKFVAYCIQNGKSLDMKIHKQKPWKDKSCRVSWKDLPLQEGDIIYIASCKKEPRSKKVGDEWVKSDTEFDWWLKDYSLVYRR